MTTKQELAQIELITRNAIAELYMTQDKFYTPLRHIEIALAELQDGVAYLKERLNNAD
jgi:hypothetical protein|nr:MAG TPA: hypothetical protein [Caudoviricetes sp.]